MSGQAGTETTTATTAAGTTRGAGKPGGGFEVTLTPASLAVALAGLTILGAGAFWLARGRATGGDADPTNPAAVVAARSWAFKPAADTFSRDALLDLRYLNEKQAGEHGFLRRSADGSGIQRGDGKPFRMWAVTDYVQDKDDPALLDRHARWLAKRGVNMVRFHGLIADAKDGAKVTDIDAKQIDRAWRLVAAMKKQGIYTTLSPYWFRPVDDVPASWNIPGAAGKPAAALLFFEPELQRGYRAWMRELLTKPNPYTGVPLARDPALAVLQLQNEDSMLFWTMQDVKGEPLKRIEQKFGAWALQKYGSLSGVRAAWNDAKADNDDWDGGRAGLLLVWEWTQQTPSDPGRARRLADQLQFFGETMRDFNASMARYLKEELGCKQMVNAGNWTTADNSKLGDVERWTHTSSDILAVNRYFDGYHKGPRAGFAMDRGDHFTTPTALKDPLQLPLGVKQAEGFPFLVTESHWVPPSGFQAEGPFMVAAYQSLSGVDGFFWFSTDEPEWYAPQSGSGKWAVATPTVMGQFPAAALLYRSGYLAEGRPVVREKRPLPDLWNRRPAALVEGPNADKARASGGRADAVDPLAFLVGPVTVQYGGERPAVEKADLGRFIDRSAKVIRSVTGEQTLDYGRGLCTIDAPRAQGACGFLAGAGPVKLSDVEISSGNPYASVLVVSLDGAALKSSKKVLVQIGTVARPTGWQDRAVTFVGEDGKSKINGREILQTGVAPFRVAHADVSVSLANPGLKTATVLDANGVPVKTEDLSRGLLGRGGRATLRVPPDALYVVLR